MSLKPYRRYVYIADIQKIILMKLEGISRRLDDLTTEVREMKALYGVPVGTISGIPKMPVDTLDELRVCESFAKASAENALQLVRD